MDVEKILGVVRLEKSRSRWRLVCLVAVALALCMAVAVALKDRAALETSEPHIARVTISGMIDEDPDLMRVLEDIKDDDSVKAVVVRINSPGGTMVGGLDTYDALREIAATRPVVTVMGTTAASAGYLIALAGDYMVASPGSLTGSIGVFMPLVDARGLADKVGIKSDSVVSGDLKDVTSPLAERNAKARVYLQSVVDALDKVFLDMVIARRKPSDDVLATVRDGRALAGVQAKDMGLVDALGGEGEARRWLKARLNSKDDLPVEEHEPADERGLLTRALQGAFNGEVRGMVRDVLYGEIGSQGIQALAR